MTNRSLRVIAVGKASVQGGQDADKVQRNRIDCEVIDGASVIALQRDAGHGQDQWYFWTLEFLLGFANSPTWFDQAGLR